MAGRIKAARDALGAHDADAAYRRGRALGVDAVAELMSSYSAWAGTTT
jgi:hypothetical protein